MEAGMRLGTATVFVWLGMVVLLRPMLTRRTAEVLAGAEERSAAHFAYVGIELVKVTR